MQRACHPPEAVRPVPLGFPDAPIWRAVRLWALGGMLLSGASLAAAAVQDPGRAMLAGARQWVAEQRGVRPDAVVFGELDARLKVPMCKDAKGWQYDFPFAHQESMRARCGDPASQLYLRVNLPGSKMAAAPGNAAKDQDAKGTRPVVVLRHGLLRGTRVTAEHLEVQQWPANNVPLQSIDNLDNAIDAELTRDVLAGKPIRSSDLRPAMLVKRGQTVTLTIRQEGGFAVVAQVEALQDGRRDDSIRLKNRESGRILTGKVVGLLSVEGQ